MTPAERKAWNVRNRCRSYHHLYGTDPHTVEGMRARATIWAITGRKPTEQELGDVLAAFAEFHRIADGLPALWHDGREVWPNDAEWPEAWAQAIERQKQTITATIQPLLGDHTP